MTWSSVLLAFLVCHLAGDFLLQTEFQARHKAGGVTKPSNARRAIFLHVLTYTAAFVPALVWIAGSRDAGRALGAAALIAGLHLVIDDGRLVPWWMERVKHTSPSNEGLSIAVDQSFHVVCLLGVALLMTA